MKKATPKQLQDIRRLQEKSLGYLLIRAGQLYNERGMALVNAQGQGPLLRDAHTRLLPHLLDAEGVRITELARRLSVSKQAVQQLVADMVAAGVVAVEPDPEDARARRVVLTAHGALAMKHGTGVLVAIEQELAPLIHERTQKQLRPLLTRLLAALTRLNEA